MKLKVNPEDNQREKFRLLAFGVFAEHADTQDPSFRFIVEPARQFATKHNRLPEPQDGFRVSGRYVVSLISAQKWERMGGKSWDSPNWRPDRSAVAQLEWPFRRSF